MENRKKRSSYSTKLPIVQTLPVITYYSLGSSRLIYRLSTASDFLSSRSDPLTVDRVDCDKRAKVK